MIQRGVKQTNSLVSCFGWKGTNIRFIIDETTGEVRDVYESDPGEKTAEDIGFIKALVYAAVLLTDFDSDAGQLLAESGYSAEDFRKYADEGDLSKIECWLEQLSEI